MASGPDFNVTFTFGQLKAIKGGGPNVPLG
jgi:hypothetical protein